MKTTLILFSVLLLTALSCRKSKTADPAPAETVYKLKSETNPATGLAYLYDYDGEGRLTKISRSNNLAKTEYSYTVPGVIKADTYDVAGNFSYAEHFELDGNGLAIRTSYPGSPDKVEREFNSDKMLTKTTSTVSGSVIGTSRYYYTGRRLDSTVNLDAALRTGSRFIYEYEENIKNTFSSVHTGLRMYGNQSPYVRKKFTQLTYDTNGTLLNTQVYHYTYETDATGRVVKITVSGNASGVSVLTYY